MFDWLFEGSSTVYLLLAALLLVFGFFAWQTRRRGPIIAAAVVVLLLLVYFLLGLAVQTDGEQIDAAVHQLAAGVTSNQLDSTFSRISDSFRRGNEDKRALRGKAEQALRTYGPLQVEVWDIQVEEMDAERRSARVRFMAKVKGVGSEPPYLCRSRFVRDPDGVWRLATFDLYNPVVDTDRPLQIP